MRQTREFSKEMKLLILQLSYTAHVGHIGSCLSIVDILAVFYSQILKPISQKDLHRHPFILSKGHAALALYAALHLLGILSKKQISSFYQNGSKFGVHPEIGIPGVELATGSLGQGIGVAAGIALARKLQGNQHRVYTLLSDAEMNEGSVWEAALFAAHHQLPITVIVDENGQQGFGFTHDVLHMSSLSKKWISFGWRVIEVDGHAPVQLTESLRQHTDGPLVIIAHTILGKGVSFMEKNVAWHYLPLSFDQYQQAAHEVSKKAS